jgi:hypothetical protein
VLDATTEAGKRTERRLREEEIAWLTTRKGRSVHLGEQSVGTVGKG